MGVPEDKIWQVIQRLARNPPTSGELDMNIVPTVFGERHCPNQKVSISAYLIYMCTFVFISLLITSDVCTHTTQASVSNIGQRNHELGSVYRSLCRGVVSNLETIMTSATLKDNSITRILGYCTTYTMYLYTL